MDPAPILAFAHPEDGFAHHEVKLWVYLDTLRCAIYPGYMANLNGYVQLPPHSVDRVLAEAYDDFQKNDPDVRDRRLFTIRGAEGYDVLQDLHVHYGLTYGPDEQGWIGFDTAHHMDDWSDEELRQVLYDSGNEDRWLHLQEMKLITGMDDMWPPGRASKKYGLPSIMWTMSRLIAETEHLAAQIYERLRLESIGVDT